MSGGLWWEPDLDRDGVCYLYQFRIGSGARRVVRTAFYVNPFTGACVRNTLTPLQGGSTQTGLGAVWAVTGRTLVIQFPSGYREVVVLGNYVRATDSMPISKPSTGPGTWFGCGSQANPYPCVNGHRVRAEPEG